MNAGDTFIITFIPLHNVIFPLLSVNNNNKLLLNLNYYGINGAFYFQVRQTRILYPPPPPPPPPPQRKGLAKSILLVYRWPWTTCLTCLNGKRGLLTISTAIPDVIVCFGSFCNKRNQFQFTLASASPNPIFSQCNTTINNIMIYS